MTDRAHAPTQSWTGWWDAMQAEIGGFGLIWKDLSRGTTRGEAELSV
jgi:hypothetical protein